MRTGGTATHGSTPLFQGARISGTGLVLVHTSEIRGLQKVTLGSRWDRDYVTVTEARPLVLANRLASKSRELKASGGACAAPDGKGKVRRNGKEAPEMMLTKLI